MRENPEVKEHLCVGTCKTNTSNDARRGGGGGVDETTLTGSMMQTPTTIIGSPKATTTRRQRVRRVVRKVWQKASLPVAVVLVLFGFLYYHDDPRRVMATIGDERERNHTPVGVIRNDVARARFIRGIGTVRSRESAGWVATGHGRRE